MQDAGRNASKAVIVISSHVARGSVGNRAAVFTLETLGFPVWAVPTVILPWHPGHGRATRIIPESGQFADLMRDLESAPWIGEVAAVLSGYLGNADQADAIASLVGKVKARNPQALYLCDPVMGDAGGLYIPEPTAAAIRDRLIPLADIATPNRFELEWLVGKELADIGEVIEAALAFSPETMIVTSAPVADTGGTGNLLVTEGEILLAEHRTIGNPPNGLGDLTGALFLARRLAGAGMAEALQSTTAAVFEILARAAKRGADELMLETDAASLSNPMALVHLRKLAHPGRNLMA